MGLYDAKFRLRKWCSNSPEFLSTIDSIDRETSAETIIDDNQTVKTLGLLWDTTCDSIKFSITLSALQAQVTKRTVLSDISKVFDTLGWLSPVVVSMELLMQQLWLKGIDWDAALPSDMVTHWYELRRGINDIRDIRIPRWVKYKRGEMLELHGFADASEIAYAAAVYLKVHHIDGLVSTNLIASKSRLAPIKQIRLPRLELCAAQLMTKLIVNVKEALEVDQVPIFGHSDSTIVLSWLSDYPRRWKTFIANRTSYILDIIPRQNWRHISSHQNPADLATRGITAYNLINSNIWWHGPNILCTNQNWEQVVLEPPNEMQLEEIPMMLCHTAAKHVVDQCNTYLD
ncbi:uncharacterized protein LOC118752630 [Rhagoletis pomonella]|uniref:uncharacterized protein LOC118752630 n=1 Tax=Rhagoletis pomonella TaxID=28610 RepID=UPI0017847754|nr:uncharacterized protein LOC118752630 [Rhagoletis pomonella]